MLDVLDSWPFSNETKSLFSSQRIWEMDGRELGGLSLHSVRKRVSFEFFLYSLKSKVRIKEKSI